MKITRTRLELSRVDFAKLMGGIDPSTVWVWEAGTRAPSPAARVLICLMNDSKKNVPLAKKAAAAAHAIDAVGG